MYGIKPVQLNPPAAEMSVLQLVDAYDKWQINERIAHAAFLNNLDSGCYIAFQACWNKCKRLVKEIEDEMERRGMNVGEDVSRNDSF